MPGYQQKNCVFQWFILLENILTYFPHRSKVPTNTSPPFSCLRIIESFSHVYPLNRSSHTSLWWYSRFDETICYLLLIYLKLIEKLSKKYLKHPNESTFRKNWMYFYKVFCIAALVFWWPQQSLNKRSKCMFYFASF